MRAEFRSVFRAAILFAGLVSQGYAAQSTTAPVILSETTEPTGAYYEQNGSNECGNSGNGSSGTTGGPTGTATVCKINFAAAPTGKYLVIEHVACNLRLGGDLLADISLATAAGTNDGRLVPLEPTIVSQGSYNYYSLNESVLYASRGNPRIVLHTEQIAQLLMTCQISGHLNVNK
jgi:hypothetical protein